MIYFLLLFFGNDNAGHHVDPCPTIQTRSRLSLHAQETTRQVQGIGGMNGACAELAIYIMKILYFNHRSNIMSIHFARRRRSHAEIIP